MLARADEVLEPERFGSTDLDDAVDRCPDGHLAHRSGDLVGSDRRDQRVGKPHRVTVGGVLGDALEELEELEELEGTNDRIGDRRARDQLLLRLARWSRCHEEGGSS